MADTDTEAERIAAAARRWTGQEIVFYLAAFAFGWVRAPGAAMACLVLAKMAHWEHIARAILKGNDQ